MAVAGSDPRRYFCTYFDSRYLLKGLALARSLERASPGFTLTVLCLDGLAKRTLDRLALSGIATLALSDLEAAVPGLLEAKRNRSLVEYYFTCTSSLVRHLREEGPAGQPLTYLDADLWFCASPEPLFDELRGHSVTMVAHRFPPGLEPLEIHGIYNVGWLSFADDAPARKCLAWWSERCLEWCYDRVEPGRFADQKYLDQWPALFSGVHAIQHRGANVAPWNVATHPITRRGDALFAGESPLLFYHFAAFKRLAPWLFEPALGSYGARMTTTLRSEVYLPYIAELRAIETWLKTAAPEFGADWGTARQPGWLPMARRLFRGELLIAR
ncbi:MAG: glycosyl transferase [Candidatus Eisenbacteria bacterium]